MSVNVSIAVSAKYYRTKKLLVLVVYAPIVNNVAFQF